MKYFIAVIVILALITLINILIESYKENRRISFSNYKLHDKRIRKNVRIVMISDLHNAQFGDHNKDLIKKIDLLKPDMIISAGDMIVGKPGKTIDIAADLLNNLGQKYPVYIGKGNHEMRTSIYPQYGDMWERLYNNTKDNVTWLINDSIYLPEYNLKIYGLDMKPEFYRRFKKLYMPDSYIKSEIGAPDEKAYNILIGHDPDYFEEYAAWGADLSLSGHIHGGLVILPHFGGFISPMIKFFPKYFKGMYECGKKRMIVSAGLGTHTLKIRVNNKPDLVTINLS